MTVAAYFRVERRGVAPGNEMSDWLDADVEHMQGSRSTATDISQPCYALVKSRLSGATNSQRQT